MKPKPTVYVLCGFIGAGKTTFAKKLEESTGAVRITKDEWLIRMVGNDPTIDGYEDYDGRMCGVVEGRRVPACRERHRRHHRRRGLGKGTTRYLEETGRGRQAPKRSCISSIPP